MPRWWKQHEWIALSMRAPNLSVTDVTSPFPPSRNEGDICNQDISLNDHPYSMHSGYLLFFETTIIGKTADLAMVQKTIIDTLHNEGKSQMVITERGGCSQSALSKHIKVFFIKA